MNFTRWTVLSAAFLPFAALAASSNISVENAGDVYMDQKHVTIRAANAYLVRTAETPKVVKVEMLVPMGARVCEETDDVARFGRHPSCGYDTYWQNRWYNQCVAWGRTRYGTRCVQWVPHYDSFPVTRMRQCNYTVSECVRYGTATHYANRSVKLVFRKAATLQAGEEEVFHLSGAQTRIGSSDVDFTLTPTETASSYQMKESDFFGDRIKAKKTGVKANVTTSENTASATIDFAE